MSDQPFDYLVPRIHGALTQVIDPELRRPITELGMVAGIEIDDEALATVHIRLTIATCPHSSQISADVERATRAVRGVRGAAVRVEAMSAGERKALIERVRGDAATRGIPFGPDSGTHVIAVTSGKGGVGKSSVTANLAVTLAQRGLAVGLIDADVFGFSIPGLLGLVSEDPAGTRTAVGPTRIDGMILPPVAHGVQTISIGMFLENMSAAVAWRGPMLHRTVKQFLTDVHFGELDVLLLDLPPGTGDVAISVAQLLPAAEILVVTTPQPAAADIAERSGTLARQTGHRIVGVVENMAGWAQPDGSVVELFGAGGGAELAHRLSAGQDAPVPLLASVPLSLALREGGDAGLPVVLSNPADPAAVAIETLGDALARQFMTGSNAG
ncbi:MAG TPA: P-loop NTPase [Microbacterium sp.]|nr:P-loop NTPase [Microbacterium sp.]